MNAGQKAASIRQRLIAHLEGGGTANDNTTDELYREAYKIPDGVETNLEAVERWAFDVVNVVPARPMTPAESKLPPPARWHWEYHPTTNQPIALIDPLGADALLITDDAEGHVYADMPEGKAEYIRDALNAYMQFHAMRDALETTVAAIPEALRALGRYPEPPCTDELFNALQHARAALAGKEYP